MQNESGAACGTANEELFPFAIKKSNGKLMCYHYTTSAGVCD